MLLCSHDAAALADAAEVQPAKAAMLVDLHLVLAIVVAASGLALAVVIVLGHVVGRPFRSGRDRVILVAIGATAASIVLGLVLLATGPGPADPLHFLYAVVALVVLPAIRFWDRLAARRGLWLGVGGVVLALLAVRLFQTG